MLVGLFQVEEEAGEVLLAEVVSADGDFSGSTFVDRNFEAFYRHEVGHTCQPVPIIKKSCPRTKLFGLARMP